MKVIVTVIGKDKPGIIAGVSGCLAQSNVNIEDISQTIISNNFTMIMQCSLENASVSLKELKDILLELGEKLGVSIHVQHEDIFNCMHKI